jgi:chromate transport protein ChrA
VAGAFFVIPSIFILFALSYTYAAYGSVAWVASVFSGLKAAIMAVVVSAVIKIGRKAIKNSIMGGLAAASHPLLMVCPGNDIACHAFPSIRNPHPHRRERPDAV